MKPKSKAVLEQEMREFYESPKMRGSGIRFIGFSKEKSKPLSPEQLKKVREFFASTKASPKPATKRKAA